MTKNNVKSAKDSSTRNSSQWIIKRLQGAAADNRVAIMIGGNHYYVYVEPRFPEAMPVVRELQNGACNGTEGLPLKPHQRLRVIDTIGNSDHPGIYIDALKGEPIIAENEFCMKNHIIDGTSDINWNKDTHQNMVYLFAAMGAVMLFVMIMSRLHFIYKKAEKKAGLEILTLSHEQREQLPWLLRCAFLLYCCVPVAEEAWRLEAGADSEHSEMSILAGVGGWGLNATRANDGTAEEIEEDKQEDQIEEEPERYPMMQRHARRSYGAIN